MEEEQWQGWGSVDEDEMDRAEGMDGIEYEESQWPERDEM